MDIKERPILFNEEMVRAILEGRKTQTRRMVNMDKLKVVPRHKVRGDYPFSSLEAKGSQKTNGVIHKAGAVSCKATSGDLLGLRPGEFDFLCPYADGKTLLDKSIDPHGVWRIEPSESQRFWVREAHAYVPEPSYRKSTGIVQKINPEDDYQACVYRENFDRACNFRWRPSIHMPRWASRIQLEITDVRVERLQDISEEDAKSEGINPDYLGYMGGNPNDDNFECRRKFKALWNSIYKNWDENPWVWVIEFKKIGE